MNTFKKFRLFLLLLNFFHAFCTTVNNGCAYCYPSCRLGLCGQYIQEFYFVNATQCQKCAPQCRTCLVSDSQCYSCSDLNHISHNSQCFCKPGYLELIGSCIKCEIPCFACKVNPSSCTECLDVNANVILDQCKCKDGMYFDNSYTCQFCDNNCKTCQQQFLCITCYQYFYLDVITLMCVDCQSPCLDCSDSINCKSCIDGYYLSQSKCIPCQIGCLNCDSQSCLLCDDNYFLINQQCEECQETCSQCKNSKSFCYICIDVLKVLKNGNCECQQGYYEVQSQCFECSYPCEICLDQYKCNKCLDISNLFLKDGICICTDGYYFNGTFCQVCDQNCLTCDQQPYKCKSCGSQIFRQLDMSTMSCSCMNGYFENGQQICQQCNNFDGTLTQECAYKNCGDNIWTYGEQCDDGNNLNRDGCTYCQIDKGYFCLNTINQSSICNRCQKNCLQCLSSNECSICMGGYFLVDGYCVQCQLGCNDCISFNQCLKCQYLIQGNQCKQCHQVQGYYLIDDQCQGICGDLIKVQNEQCDDGNTINNDGCDKKCKIEDGYTYKNNHLTKIDYPTPKIVSIDTNLYDSIKQFELTYDQPLKFQQFNWIFDISISINNLTQGIDYNPMIIDQSSIEQGMVRVKLKILLVLNNKSLNGDQIIISFFDLKKFTNIDGYTQQTIQVQCKISNFQFIDDLTKEQTQQAIMYNQYLLYILLIFVLISILFGGMEAYNNLLDLIQLVSYLQFVNTQLPYNYQTYLDLFQFAQFSFFSQYFTIEQYYIEYIDQSRLEIINQKFSQAGYYSNIILNLHSIMNVWVILFLIYFLSLILAELIQDIKIIIKVKDSQSMITLKACLIQIKKHIFKASYNLNHSFFYSAIIRTFMAIFYDLSFMILINLSALDFTDPYCLNNIGSLVTLMFCSLYFLIFIFFFRTLRNKKNLLIRLQNQYGPLFEDLKLRNQKYFNVYILIKKLYFMTSLVLLFNNPLYQIINMTFASLLQIVYMIAKKPLLNNFEQLKQLLCEIYMFLIQILICFLVLNDQQNQLVYQQRQNIGWACIFLTSLMLITQIIFDIMIYWKGYIKQIRQFKRKIFLIFNIERNEQPEINILDPLRQLF